MKIDNINVDEVLEDLTKRVEKLESYHTISEINLSYGKWYSRSEPEKLYTWDGTIMQTNNINEILISIIPKEFQGSKLIVETEGVDKNCITTTFNENYSKLNVVATSPFFTTITVNIYSTDKKIKGTIPVIGYNGNWAPGF